MKKSILIVLVVIAAILVLGSAVASQIINDAGIGNDADSNIINKIFNKLNNIESSESSNSIKNSNSNSEESFMDTVNDIVKEEVKFNHQNGEGYYREVTYKDGGFRQYDTETGELIGSSYDSDQDKLPSME